MSLKQFGFTGPQLGGIGGYEDPVQRQSC